MPMQSERDAALESFRGHLFRIRASIEIAPHMIECLERYIGFGELQGSFLTAVLEDKFLEAFACADEGNTANMKSWAQIMYSCVSPDCRGSRERVNAWIETQPEHVDPSSSIDTSAPEAVG